MIFGAVKSENRALKHVVVKSKVTAKYIEKVINFTSSGNWRVCFVDNALEPLPIDAPRCIDGL